MATSRGFFRTSDHTQHTLPASSVRRKRFKDYSIGWPRARMQRSRMLPTTYYACLLSGGPSSDDRKLENTGTKTGETVKTRRQNGP